MDDAELWDLTSTDAPDQPVAIAAATRRLIERKEEVVNRARIWISEADVRAEMAWVAFVSSYGI